MTHPGRLSVLTLAVTAFLGVSAPHVAAQAAGDASADPNARDRAERVAAFLTVDLPCTATGTAAALERRLAESIDPLVDLAAGLDIMAASTDNCAEVRAAAARQRLYIAEATLSGTETTETPLAGTRLALTFEVGPPPRNLLRQRGGSR